MSTAQTTTNSAGLAGVLEATQSPLTVSVEITEQLQKENAKLKRDLAEATEVGFGPNGIEIRNIGGLWRMANMYARSQMVPDNFKQKPENCAIAIQLAQRMKCDIFMLMQHMYIVHGRPGIEAKLAIALANAGKVYAAPIAYKMEGQGASRSCTAWAKDAISGELCEMTVSIQTAKDMGWWSKRDKNGNESSLWPKMPELMLRYRAAMWLIRTTHPEVIMGMLSTEEIHDGVDAGLREMHQAVGREAIQEVIAETEASMGTSTTDDPADMNAAAELADWLAAVRDTDGEAFASLKESAKAIGDDKAKLREAVLAAIEAKEKNHEQAAS